MARVNRVLEIEFGQIIGVGVEVVAVPRLA